MNSITETCIIPVPKDEVFRFLSNIENLPKWSTKFVQRGITNRGKLKAITPIGGGGFRFDGNKE